MVIRITKSREKCIENKHENKLNTNTQTVNILQVLRCAEEWLFTRYRQKTIQSDNSKFVTVVN